MTLAFTAPRYKDIRMEIAEDVLHRELAITVAEMEYPPFRFADEKPPGRLVQASVLVLGKRVHPLEDPPGHWLVQGKRDRYTVGARCSCPASAHSSSKWCYHAVAVEMYRRLQARLNLPVPAWVGSLPLKGEPGPVPMARTPLLLTEDPTGLDVEEKDEGRRMNDERETMEEQEEGSMRPEEVDLPDPSPIHPSSFTLHPSPRVPSLSAQALTASMAEWAAQRRVIAAYVREHMQEGIDYYTLSIKGRQTRPTLSKSGSETFLSLFHLQATFSKDADTWEMLGRPAGVLCYLCHLRTREGEIVGEGRGARNIARDDNDINKTIKMAQKSAQVDAVLRTGALSELFYQDLEDHAGA